jgi:diguanylate cyclase (GGDEF)-like protein/PAS domain S-box-containing protein
MPAESTGTGKTTHQPRSRPVSDEASILLSLPDIVWFLDEKCVFRLCNKAFEAFTGQARQALSGLLPPFDGMDLPPFIARFMAGGQQIRPQPTEYAVRHPKTGEHMHFETTEIKISRPDGTIAGYACVAHDITKRKALELELVDSRNEMFRHAYYDPLTNLPNLRQYAAKDIQTIASLSSGQNCGAVLKIDLDSFGMVNDLTGRASGDRVLKELADRLRLEADKTGDFLARLDGASFVMIVGRTPGGDEVARDCERLLGQISRPIFVDYKLLTVTASIGASYFPEHSNSKDELLTLADHALHLAKRGGRNTWHIFTNQLIDEARDRFALETDLRNSIEDGSITAHFQAKINLSTREISGVEALMRWRHPQMGSIPPGVFIPLADETGLIVPLGQRVLTNACHFARLWHDGTRKPLRVSVNLSPRQVMYEDFMPMLRDCLSHTGCKPEWLEIEITENVLISDAKRVDDLMVGLDALGIAVTIDDFGTGFSAIRSLTRYPIGTLKIDRGFVHCKPDDRKGPIIARTIVAMARELGIKCVAEGIETQAEAEFMQQIGCDEGQGFLWQRPMSEDDFFRWAANFGSMLVAQ